MKKLCLIYFIINFNIISCKKAPEYSKETYEATIFRLKAENDSLKEKLYKCSNWIELLESKNKTQTDSLKSKMKVKSFLNKITQTFKFRNNRVKREKQRVYQYLDSLINAGEINKGDIDAQEIERLIDSLKSINQ